MARARLLAFSLLLGLIACCMRLAAAAVDDFEDEFDGLNAHTQQAKAAAAPKPPPAKRPKIQASKVVGFRFNAPTTFVPEALVVFAAAAFIVSFWLGKRFNQRIALAFTGWACKHGGVLQRNFELVGPGTGSKRPKQILLRQTPNNYLVWASGRRCVFLSHNLQTCTRTHACARAHPLPTCHHERGLMAAWLLLRRHCPPPRPHRLPQHHAPGGRCARKASTA